MKKSLIALAVLAASGAAMAQSSVTMFGIVDAGVGRIAGDSSVTGVFNSGNATSRLGFRGVEDLGGGLKAGFWLEGAIQNDTGTGAGGGAAGPGFEFKRRATVSLMGNFGELRLGRELTAGYDKPSSYDPFGQVGVANFFGFGVLGSPSRIGNGVSYRTPGNLGGFFGVVHYAFGETPSNAAYDKAGNYLGLAGGYENGPLSVTLAADKLRGATAAQDVTTYSIAGSYDLGVVKPVAIWHSEKDNAAVQTKYNTYLVGLTAPVGPGSVKAAYFNVNNKNTNNDSSVFAVGYVYDLSKRTAVYGTYARLDNKNGANRILGNGTTGTNGLTGAAVGLGNNVNGYQVGIRHSF
ncbi:porin [Paracidovorax anthurii]|uniref:Putative porin n=1 Tax=Paracidovorax anthurii TaxID=78229 RepID=A0A328ZUM7_9BURK|nr:porin [Paracidovorax anthurii]RAR85966.1 putative porin [Paracidovorax anthurii]